MAKPIVKTPYLAAAFRLKTNMSQEYINCVVARMEGGMCP